MKKKDLLKVLENVPDDVDIFVSINVAGTYCYRPVKIVHINDYYREYPEAIIPKLLPPHEVPVNYRRIVVLEPMLKKI